MDNGNKTVRNRVQFATQLLCVKSIVNKEQVTECLVTIPTLSYYFILVTPCSEDTEDSMIGIASYEQ